MVVKANLGEIDVTLPDRSKRYDSEEGVFCGYNSSPIGLHLPLKKGGLASKNVDISLHDRLSAIYRAFSKYKSMYYTLESAVEEACKMFDCGYSRVLIANYFAKKIYNESGGYLSIEMGIRINEID